MIPAHEITGVILAGGKSRRMGTDKALLALNGKPFIQHVAEAFQSVFTDVVISANTTEYEFLGLPVIGDVYTNCGPLGGIHAALGLVRTPHIFTAPCDVPFLHSTTFETLLQEAEPGVIAVASAGGQLHPLVGVYPAGCRSALETFLVAGGRRVSDFLATMGFRTVRRDGWAETLGNINEVGQYRGLM